MTAVRVLIVEDEVDVAEALRRGLTADGFTPDVVDNGTDGLWMAQNNPYAVIVLDIMLPGLNGYRICRSLRDGGDMTPVLMLTAKDGEWDEAEGLDIGADDYLTKPFSYMVLLARLRALIRRADGRTSSRTLDVDDLHIDLDTRRCARGGETVELSPKAFSVLEYLMRRAGQVVSKADILANVWGHDFDGDPNIVEVYVSRIRAGVDHGDTEASIETIRGVGYRLKSRAANDR